MGKTAQQALSAALAAVRRVEEVWGGEAETVIAVSDGRVSSRTLNLPERRGGWRGARLSYGKTLAACTRTVLEDEVFTALYGYGKGLPIYDEQGVATGGFTRRLTFGSVNGGANWVGDEGARLAWGRWNADRTERVHRFGSVVFPDCEDVNGLKALTLAALRSACVPRVSYEVDVAAVEGGMGVRLGDAVAVIDSSRVPEWHLRAHCVRRVREFGEGAHVVRLTLGSVERTTWAASADVVARVTAVASDTVATFEDLGSEEF